MDVAALLGRGRAAAESLMVDQCVIRRITAATTDPDTAVTTPTYLSPDVYAGKCRVQQHQATADAKDVGEDRVLLLRIEVQLPMSVVGLQVGDAITVTSSALDPDLAGRVFLVHDLAHKTHATARRVQCIERTGS